MIRSVSIHYTFKYYLSLSKDLVQQDTKSFVGMIRLHEVQAAIYITQFRFIDVLTLSSRSVPDGQLEPRIRAREEENDAYMCIRVCVCV